MLAKSSRDESRSKERRFSNCAAPLIPPRGLQFHERGRLQGPDLAKRSPRFPIFLQLFAVADPVAAGRYLQNFRGDLARRRYREADRHLMSPTGDKSLRPTALLRGDWLFLTSSMSQCSRLRVG